MTIDQWRPALEVWKAFCAANPGLALRGTKWSFSWFRQRFGEAMLATDVMRRTTSRRYLLNTETFPAAAFNVLTKEK